MRTLTSTLLNTQKAANRTPCVQVTAKNLMAGVVNLKWNRLYTGSEADGPHALTLAGDGSLIRLRITPGSDNCKLYSQRVTSPGSGSDYSQWTYLNQYGVVTCATCSMGNKVSLVWIKDNNDIIYQESLDNGATWQNKQYPGFSPGGMVTGVAAAYKSNGDLAIFVTDTSVLYIVKRISGTWQSIVAWNQTVHDLSGVAAIYDGDWKLLLCGQDTSDNYKVWSLVYGDGSEVPAGTWSPLQEIASAPADSNYEFHSPALDRGTDCFRCFYIEKFSGSPAYQRPYWSHTLPGTGFLENRWREPVPFETEITDGLALAHSSSYAWLAMPSGVWRADLAEQSLDLSNDITLLKHNLAPDNGDLTLELKNTQGQYNTPGTGSQEVLETGCRIDVSPGYRSSQGNEYSSGLSFILQAYEHTSAPGKASLILHAVDGWSALANWTARYQFRWNKPDQYGNPTQEASVKEILTRILARSGIRITVISQSTTITGFYPDFTLHPGDNGKAAINRLLSFVPDCLFMEGDIAYLVNPGAGDPAVYDYGTGHIILEGRYLTGSWKINRVKAEGPGISASSFAWDEIQKQGDIMETVEDLNLTDAAGALARGQAILRKVDMDSVFGYLRVPVNCGQQLYDVVAITDPRAGLAAAKRRILGITLSYLPAKAEYEQRLELGAP